MKRLLNITFLLFVLLSMVGLNASAHDIEVTNAEGKTIYYNFINNTKLEVTYRGSSYDFYSNDYSGNVVIPESVTYNGKTYSVTSIGYGAFYECSGLTSVSIPNSVTSIGDDAFHGCTKLTSVSIPNSVWSIGEMAFYKCSELTSVTMGSGVTSIGDYAFCNCYRLSSITIPNSVTSIGYGAFYECSGLTSIKVQEGNTKYDSRNNCNAIIETATNTLVTGCKNTVIPNSVTSIGNYAFAYCSGLTSITIPNSVTSIGESAFNSCPGLTSITIPNSVTSIEYRVFYGCSGLTSITIPNSVKSIGSSAFRGCSGLTSITIPNSVTSIGERAFSGCSGLTSITIPNSVTSIGNWAFYDCSKLTLVESRIGKVFGIADNGFTSETYYNAELRVPRDLSSMYKQATGWKKFKSITEGNVGVCGNNLTYTYSSGELTIHGTGAMYDYSKSSPVPWDSYKNDIIKIVIEDGARSIGDYAFSGCSNLYSITIPNSVTSIGERAFYSCGQISITIPNSVTSIGRYAFSNCDGLTSVTIGNSVTSIGDYAFQCCSRLTSITIPNSVTSIGYQAFSGCSGLTSVTFHCNNVGTWFSVLSSIKEVWIEKEVTSIAQQSFAGCSGLQSVYNNAKDAFTIAKNTFDDATYSKAKLYVPTGMKATYEETPWWVNFKKIEEMSGKYILTYKVDGKVYKQYEVAYGTTITPEPAPTKEGYIFSGWSEIPTTMPARDVTVTGTFTAKYTLTYKVDGEVYKQYEVAYGSAITPEPAPSKTGYTFSGWSEIPTTMPANNVIVTGTFTDDSYVGGIYYNYSDTEVMVVSGANKYTGDVTIPASVSSGGKTYSVTSIGDDAFHGCSGLTSVSIPNSVKSIGNSAFESCSKLTSVSIPNSVKSIGERAFYNCYRLSSITIPNSVKSIGNSAFEYCSGLFSITIPNSVTSIGNWAFYDCKGLTSISVQEGNTKYDSRNNCNAIIETATNTLVTGCKNTIIPNNVTSIGGGAFWGCSGLTSVSIPNSVTSIGSVAFWDCI